jgi:hypothetical protein
MRSQAPLAAIALGAVGLLGNCAAPGAAAVHPGQAQKSPHVASRPRISAPPVNAKKIQPMTAHSRSGGVQARAPSEVGRRLAAGAVLGGAARFDPKNGAIIGGTVVPRKR